jgi:hypothetical protein
MSSGPRPLWPNGAQWWERLPLSWQKDVKEVRWPSWSLSGQIPGNGNLVRVRSWGPVVKFSGSSLLEKLAHPVTDVACRFPERLRSAKNRLVGTVGCSIWFSPYLVLPNSGRGVATYPCQHKQQLCWGNVVRTPTVVAKWRTVVGKTSP